MNFQLILALLIAFVFILITLGGVKKSLILYIAIKPFLLPTFSLLDVPGVPLIDVDRVLMIILSLGFILEYFTFPRGLYPKKIPLLKIIIYFTLLLFIIVIRSVIGFGTSLGYLINYFFENILILFLVWHYFNDEATFFKVLKIIIVVSLIVNIYGIFNFISNTNPFIDYFESSSHRKLISIYDEIEYRFGFNRAQSTFNHPMVYGAYNVFIFMLSLAVFLQKKNKLNYNILAMVLAIIGIFITNSRSPIIFLFISTAYFFMISNIIRKKVFQLLPLMVLISTVLYITVPFVGDLINGILNPDSAGGSTLDMRVVQFFASLYYFNQFPLSGFGLGKVRELNLTRIDTELHGIESFLFQIMIDGGIVGIIAYSILFVGIFMAVKKLGRSFKGGFYKNLNIGLKGIILGYIAFIFATGPLATFQWFFLFVGLGLVPIKFESKHSRLFTKNIV